VLLGLNDEFYHFIVRFADGTYYRGWNVWTDPKTTDDITKATLYSFDWQVYKDMYFKMYLDSVDVDFEIIEVKVERKVTIVNENY